MISKNTHPLFLFCWIIFIALLTPSLTAQITSFDGDKAPISYNAQYAQEFNPAVGWDHIKFYGQWSSLTPYTFYPSDISSGYLQFVWIGKRVLCSKKAYSQPYTIETDIDYSAGANRGGVVIRIKNLTESVQEPVSDPGFNRDGIAFYPSSDGSSMIVQFSGADLGYASGMAIKPILVPKPAGVASLKNRGKLRIEDYGSSIYVYYNDEPFIRIELNDKIGTIYTSGTVYRADLQVAGIFTGMEVEDSGKVAVAQRDATMRLYSGTINYNDLTLPTDTTTLNKPYRDLFSDTWVATDAIGRKMPSFDDVGPVKEDKRRVVSIFYITWHTEDHFSNFKSPYAADVSKILKTDPSARLDGNHPLWTEGSYHWGEPELGYFLSQDEYVIRKDMAMLATAGVDVLVMDVTNAVRYWDEWVVLFTTMQKMKNEGKKVPQFCFWAFNGPVITVVQDLFDNIYKVSNFKDLWFYWDGKPLLLYNGKPDKDATGQVYQNPNPHYIPAAVTDVNHPYYGDPYYTQEYYTDYTQEVKDFFTLRTMWWGYYEWAGARFVGTEDNWSFGYDLSDDRVKAMNPDDLVSTHNNSKEQAAVTPAQHPSSLVGKSWRRETGQPVLNEFDKASTAFVPWLEKTVSNPEGYGIYFQDRWDEALKTDPEFLYINDWNEWTAGKYAPTNGGVTPFMRRNSTYFFVDQYNDEFNRCVQPMKGGYTDNYYMQMAQNIRKYKGVRPGSEPQRYDSIRIDGQFSDWDKIVNEYRDAEGDTYQRNHNGYGGLHYTNETGRNDIVTSKVTFDNQNISFYVKTAQALTPSSDSNWMLLFLDTDRNKGTGWEGYDFVINHSVLSNTQTTVKQWDGVGWVNEFAIPISLNGDAFELSVPRTALLMEEGIPEFYFHWSDNAQQLNDISCFFNDGESAPDRRFDYNFSSSPIETLPQSPFKEHSFPCVIEFEDFDNGGVGIAYADANIGNAGAAYRPGESVDIGEKSGDGFYVGWTNSGEWLEYTVNVNAIGLFTLGIHYASDTDGNEVSIYMNNVDKTGTLTFPSSGGIDTWAVKETDLQLRAGEYVLMFRINKASKNFNLDKITISEKSVVYPGEGTGLTRTFWKGTAGGRTWFADSICTDTDSSIDEAWADISPGCEIDKDFWNVRWEGMIEPLFSETYTFHLTVNDIGRLWVNNQLVIDAWSSAFTNKTTSGTIDLTAGQKVPIKLDFAEKLADAKVKLEWSSTSNPIEIVPSYQLFPLNQSTLIVDTESTFSVYPNPANDQISINSRKLPVDGISISDLQGRIVYSNNESFAGTKTYNLSLEKGIYLILLKGDVTFKPQKIIIE